jgi:hypothetical protein
MFPGKFNVEHQQASLAYDQHITVTVIMESRGRKIKNIRDDSNLYEAKCSCLLHSQLKKVP